MEHTIKNKSTITELPGAVIFDTDNTLYAYEPAHTAAQTAVCKKVMKLYGISKNQFQTLYADARFQIKQQLPGTAASHSRLLYFQRLLENMGLRAQLLQALDLEQTYWRTFLANAEIFEGVTDLLDELRLKSIPTAIVTDLTAQVQFRKIIYFGLDYYFDHVVTSEEAGYDKPSPAPFELVMTKIGEIKGRTWMIGDNPRCDIKGARDTINAITLQKVHKGVELMKGEFAPDFSFNDFKQVHRLIENLPKK